MTKQELTEIKKELRTIKPKTEVEKRVSELVGRPQTRGQLIRNAVIGAGAGVGSGAIGNWIEKKPIMTGRGALRSSVMGVTFGAAMPAMKRLIDIEAAKRGQY